MTKAAMTCITGASLRRLVRPLLGVATIAALGIAVTPEARAEPAAGTAIERGIVAKAPSGKSEAKDKLANHARPAASLSADDADQKKKDEAGPK